MFVCSGILFNHESPRNRYEFVTRKITFYAARIKLGLGASRRWATSTGAATGVSRPTTSARCS